jgi:hypothetical protein
VDGGVLAGRFARAGEILHCKTAGRDFGGYTFQGTSLIFWIFGRKLEGAIGQVMDLVKRCDQPGKKFSSNLRV